MTTKSQTTPEATGIRVRSVAPCLTFSGNAEEAIRLYVSTIKDSRILSIVRSPAHPDGGAASVLHAMFELNGAPFTAMDGGDSFRFSQGFSIAVTCDTQAEIDAIWSRLTEGGEESWCGWLTDRFGLSWQVVPTSLGEMLSNPEGGNTQAVIDAFLKMRKFDIATLERAYKSA